MAGKHVHPYELLQRMSIVDLIDLATRVNLAIIERNCLEHVIVNLMDDIPMEHFDRLKWNLNRAQGLAGTMIRKRINFDTWPTGPVVPVDVRARWYYVMPMPINAKGHGPASIENGEARKLTWEVWDQEFVSYASYDFLPDAIQECERLNMEKYSARNSSTVPTIGDHMGDSEGGQDDLRMFVTGEEVPDQS